MNWLEHNTVQHEANRQLLLVAQAEIADTLNGKTIAVIDNTIAGYSDKLEPVLANLRGGSLAEQDYGEYIFQTLLGGLLPQTGAEMFQLWFGEGVKLVNVPVRTAKHLPPNISGVVITGSPSSVITPDVVTQANYHFLTQAQQLGLPVLGICYGHQVISAALGGAVQTLVQGRQMGVCATQITNDGMELLTRVFGPTVKQLNLAGNVSVLNHDAVTKYGAHSTALMLADKTNINQGALHRTEHNTMLSFQFHPELDPFIHLLTGEIVTDTLQHPSISADVLRLVGLLLKQ